MHHMCHASNLCTCCQLSIGISRSNDEYNVTDILLHPCCRRPVQQKQGVVYTDSVHPMYVSAVEKLADATTKARSTRLPYLLLLPLLLKLPAPSLLESLLQDWTVPSLRLLQLSLAVPSAEPPGLVPPGFGRCADASELIQTHERPSLSAHL